MNSPLRSLLFVPGDRPDRFDKAAASGADAIVLDLEDAVAAAHKAEARAAVCQWLLAAPGAAPLCIVRINARGTPWFADDVAALRGIGLPGLMLAKCEQAADLDELPGDGLWPLIESAQGLARATAIARAPRVRRLVFGSLDFQLDLGLEADAEETELAPYRAQLVLASRLAGLAPPVDGVTTALHDDERLAADTRRALRQGFGAKLCIHPRQVAGVHAALHPGEAAIAQARRVLAAAAASGGAAVALDGAMVDRPVILRAQGVLTRAGLATPTTMNEPQETAP